MGVEVNTRVACAGDARIENSQRRHRSLKGRARSYAREETRTATRHASRPTYCEEPVTGSACTGAQKMNRPQVLVRRVLGAERVMVTEEIAKTVGGLLPGCTSLHSSKGVRLKAT